MLDDVEIRLECLRLAAVLHENDVPDVTQLIGTSEALVDYVRGETKAGTSDLLTGFLRKNR